MKTSDSDILAINNQHNLKLLIEVDYHYLMLRKQQNNIDDVILSPLL